MHYNICIYMNKQLIKDLDIKLIIVLRNYDGNF